MKILWLDINSSFSHSSLAIPSLDAQLPSHIREQHNWNIVSGTINKNISHFVSEIISIQPDIILSTAWLFNHSILQAVLKRVYSIDNSIKIVLGGPEFLGDNRDYLVSNRHIYAVFKGDGEEIFPEFIQNLDNPKKWLELSGFCYIKDGDYIDSKAYNTKDFNNIKFPETSKLFNWKRPFVQIETSRGCFNSCAFCISGIPKGVQNLDIDQIEERINRCIQNGIKEIRILDRTFNANRSRAEQLLSLFYQYREHLNFHLEVHPALIDNRLKDSINKFKGDHLHIEAGIQSLDQNVIDLCTRIGTVEESLCGLNYMINQANLIVHTDLIAGLPGYTLERLFNDTISLIELNPDEIQLELLKLLPGTKFKEDALSFGIKYSPEPPYEVLQTDSMSYSHLQISSSLSEIIDMFYNHSMWKDVFRSIIINNREALNKIVDFYISRFERKIENREKRGLFLYDFCLENEYSQVLDVIQLWNISGLSLKMGPGLLLNGWNPKTDLNNPIFIENKAQIKYRYLDYKNKRIWYAYDIIINNSKPIREFIEIL